MKTKEKKEETLNAKQYKGTFSHYFIQYSQ